MNRKLPEALRQSVDRVMRRSVEYAFANPNTSYPFVKQYAQEMDETVMRSHIELYVNDFFTRDLATKGVVPSKRFTLKQRNEGSFQQSVSPRHPIPDVAC